MEFASQMQDRMNACFARAERSQALRAIGRRLGREYAMSTYFTALNTHSVALSSAHTGRSHTSSRRSAHIGPRKKIPTSRDGGSTVVPKQVQRPREFAQQVTRSKAPRRANAPNDIEQQAGPGS
jgi:hypothetical protein